MPTLNPYKAGTLGEIAVCKELIRFGYDVFVEFGGHSKVDLVVLDEKHRASKIQVKTAVSKDEVVVVYSVKKCLNPKYNSKYTTDQIDVFAVYVIDHDLIFYISAKEILANGSTSKFRLSEPKNNQKNFVRFVNDFLNFEKALRDCTPHAQPAFAAGDETVQTTTPNRTAAGESQCGK